MYTLPIVGIILIGIFIIYLINQLNHNIYIQNIDNEKDKDRTKIIYIQKENKVTENGDPILSKFEPLTIDINIGDTIQFINNDVLRHSIEIHNDNIQNSKIILPNDTFIIPINVSDDIQYSSSLYPKMMSGTIYIQSKKHVNKIQKNIVELKNLTNNMSNNLNKTIGNIFYMVYNKIYNSKQFINNLYKNLTFIIKKTYNEFKQIISKILSKLKIIVKLLLS